MSSNIDSNNLKYITVGQELSTNGKGFKAKDLGDYKKEHPKMYAMLNILGLACTVGGKTIYLDSTTRRNLKTFLEQNGQPVRTGTFILSALKDFMHAKLTKAVENDVSMPKSLFEAVIHKVSTVDAKTLSKIEEKLAKGDKIDAKHDEVIKALKDSGIKIKATDSRYKDLAADLNKQIRDFKEKSAAQNASPVIPPEKRQSSRGSSTAATTENAATPLDQHKAKFAKVLEELPKNTRTEAAPLTREESQTALVQAQDYIAGAITVIPDSGINPVVANKAVSLLATLQQKAATLEPTNNNVAAVVGELKQVLKAAEKQVGADKVNEIHNAILEQARIPRLEAAGKFSEIKEMAISHFKSIASKVKDMGSDFKSKLSQEDRAELDRLTSQDMNRMSTYDLEQHVLEFAELVERGLDKISEKKPEAQIIKSLIVDMRDAVINYSEEINDLSVKSDQQNIGKLPKGEVLEEMFKDVSAAQKKRTAEGNAQVSLSEKNKPVFEQAAEAGRIRAARAEFASRPTPKPTPAESGALPKTAQGREEMFRDVAEAQMKTVRMGQSKTETSGKNKPIFEEAAVKGAESTMRRREMRERKIELESHAGRVDIAARREKLGKAIAKSEKRIENAQYAAKNPLDDITGRQAARLNQSETRAAIRNRFNGVIKELKKNEAFAARLTKGSGTLYNDEFVNTLIGIEKTLGEIESKKFNPLLAEHLIRGPEEDNMKYENQPGDLLGLIGEVFGEAIPKKIDAYLDDLINLIHHYRKIGA